MIKEREAKGDNVVPIIFHQLVYLEFLTQGLPNLRRQRLRSYDILKIGAYAAIPEDILHDLRCIIFYGSNQEVPLNSIEASLEKNWIKERMKSLYEYTKLEEWFARNQ